MPFFTANDGVSLHYKTHGSAANRPLILLHGFTGSGEVFKRNVDDLSKHQYVLVPDLRGHGESEKPKTGYHVARLAMDLKNFIDYMKLESYGSGRDVFAIGTSLGAAILWSYAELFTTRIFDRLVFVDQAPLQNYLSDWGPGFGNRGLNSPAALEGLQRTLIDDPATAHRGTIAGCLGYRWGDPHPGDPSSSSRTWREDEEFFLSEALKGDGWWYGKLMADHTARDWRDAIAHNLGPGSLGGNNQTKVMVVTSHRSGCFPPAGPLKVAELVNGGNEKGRANSVVLDKGGHWCYWEDPQEFNNLMNDYFYGKWDD